MWTPRRTFMVIMGLILFSGGFTLYSELFGWIDGLPPLPPDYKIPANNNDLPQPIPPGSGPLQLRLRLAFGPNCLEQTEAYMYKFESRGKGILFAAMERKILDDGRLQVEQMSMAVFDKTGKEITTLHCDRSVLTFDHPIRKIEDISTSKFMAAEMYADPEYPTHDPRRGKIHVINNRKTPEPDDDLILLSPGPVFYVEEPTPGQPHIMTHAFIEVTDRQNRPLPTQPEAQMELPTVTAIGGRVYLKKEPPAPKGKAPVAKAPAPPKQAGGSSGVERIELDRQVLMNLWSGSSGLSGPDKNPPPPNSPPAEKNLIVIQTNGPFVYDGIKDMAHFEIPPKSEPNLQEFVRVTRHTKGNSEDTLTSDFLDVQFKRDRETAPGAAGPLKKDAALPAKKETAAAPTKKNAPAAPAKKDGAPAEAAANSPEMEIDTIHAWGKEIALTSDQDALEAHGYDLFYDARIKQTILKGAPTHAVKDGNLIRARELILNNTDDKLKQNMHARGPGIVGMGEVDPKTQEYAKQAHWQDWLVVTKVNEQGKDLDLITLTGNAVFLDTVNDQRLSAQQIKVWLLSADDGKPDPKDPKKAVAKAPPPKKVNADGKTADDMSKAKPHRLEAIADVMVNSPDMMVHRCDYLNVWFKDLPPPLLPPLPGAAAPLPGAAALNPTPANANSNQPPAHNGNPNAGATARSDPKPPAGQAAKTEPAAKDAEPEKKKPPMIVRRAARMEMWVNRIEGRNDLDKVHMEGFVVIHQDPQSEDDKGIDIAGHTVDLQHFVEGNNLYVTGNDKVIGEVHFDKVTIIGDNVKIDQRDNSANVVGPGSMRMLSQASLVAEPDKKPPPVDKTKKQAPAEKQPDKWIEIYWNDSMELQGAIRSITYEGSVQAKQDEGKVLCAAMQVWLDRPLYLNQAVKPKEPHKTGKKGEEDNSPKVKEVLCDQMPSKGQRPKGPPVPVWVENSERGPHGQLIKYDKVVGSEVKMDNENNKMEAIGPGDVVIWDKGKRDMTADPAAPDPKKAPGNPANKKGGASPPAYDPKRASGYPPNDPKKGQANPGKKDTDDDDQEMKLTRVAFDRKMVASNVMPKRAIFYNDVELVHMPSDKHDVEINLAKLPARALHLRCKEWLEVTTQSRKERDKNGDEIEIKWQEMKAQGNVVVRSDDFDGWGHLVTYSEDKSLLVFYGDAKTRTPAVLNRQEQKGGERKTFKGEKITYNVKTKDFNIDGSIGGGN